MDELRGKVAIVTGASRGIGAAAALEFAAMGSSVVLASRTARQIEEVAQRIRDGGGSAIALTCDVANYSDVEAMVAAAVDRFGGVDVLVNNAGLIDPIARLAESDPEAWARVANTNYLGVYNGLRAVLPRMVAESGGVIVNVSSGAATSALEGWSHYCSSKAAALMLTRCADMEYRQHNIRVVGLSPGTVATDMQVAIKKSGINPVSQLDPSVHIPPEWAAKAIVWLCTKAAQDLSGEDFSLKDAAARQRVGLPA